ncbi:hypothetical protein [uncultured Sphingomonas sp.]|uniref:hypothetical protein n=1 Tax=uncultured Sphingomonas sp. TaxID=158754 RepID=UPI0025FE2E29|nr:hypothetical protein [uncultured Sphingomonas sp.]
MARRSLVRRMDQIRDALWPRGSLARRIVDLPEPLARWHREWRAECAEHAARITAADGPGALYERYLRGADDSVPMPWPVERALYPNGRNQHVITAEMTFADAADAYTAMLNEGVQR